MVCVYISSGSLAFSAFVLFLVGCIGHSDDRDAIRYIPWGVTEFSGLIEGKAWLGTSAYVIDFDSSAADDYDEKYEDCDEDWCETCEEAGSSAIGLTIVALVLALLTMLTSGLQGRGTDGAFQQIVASICALGSAFFPIIAFVVFRECFADFVDNYSDIFGSSSGTYGTGAWIVLFGFILMVIAAITNLFICCGTVFCASSL